MNFFFEISVDIPMFSYVRMAKAAAKADLIRQKDILNEPDKYFRSNYPLCSVALVCMYIA